MPVAEEAGGRAGAFARYQLSSASRLRYTLAELNLRDCHDLERPLIVLDAGGGNGLIAEFLLELGHQVTICDEDPEMLGQAEARLKARDLLARCRLVQVSLEKMAETLKGDVFDLILCHHVLEYIDDGLRLLHVFHRLCRQNGDLSLITLNPVSEVVRAIVFRQDPVEAARKLTDFSYDAKWFGRARLYPLQDITARAQRAGWHLKDFRGIRVLADYVSEAVTQSREEELLRLEVLLASSDPYRRMGRYLQFAFTRQTPD